MQEKKIRNLMPCVLCGAEVVLRRNAAKMFQVMCPCCGAHTSWGRKSDVIITWYNMSLQLMKNNGQLNDEKGVLA